MKKKKYTLEEFGFENYYDFYENPENYGKTKSTNKDHTDDVIYVLYSSKINTLEIKIPSFEFLKNNIRYSYQADYCRPKGIVAWGWIYDDYPDISYRGNVITNVSLDDDAERIKRVLELDMNNDNELKNALQLSLVNKEKEELNKIIKEVGINKKTARL